MEFREADALATDLSAAPMPSPQTDANLPVAVHASPVPPDADLKHPSLYFNRELSWLDFNWRVMFQALDERTPLLERVRFLAITQRNLDEFLAKRVSGLKSRIAVGMEHISPDGRTTREELDRVREAANAMQTYMAGWWEKQLRPRIRDVAGIHAVCSWDEVTEDDRVELTAFFRSNIYPILTPLAVDPAHPFPFISHLSLSLAIVLRHPQLGSEHFARLKLPLNRGRWVRFGDGHNYMAIETLVAQHVGELFRGMDVESTHVFRVTRDAELDWDAGVEAEDILESISEELRERRFAPAVRLEVAASMPRNIRELLINEMSLEPSDVFEIDGLLDLTSVEAFADVDMPALKFPPWEPITPLQLHRVGRAEGDTDMFAAIRAGDVLVHHPYESFAASVERFIDLAATDKQVLAIKQTLYRVSDDSRVARALIRAAEEGKQVAVIVEVTASLDEQRNIDWAQRMEKTGVHVTYGVVGLKTHTKITLIVREESDGIRTYCHIGTGNYHERTARLYTDLGLFTSSPGIGRDVVNLFHFLTGFAPEQTYSHLLVAPRDMRNVLVDLVRREMARGPQGRIIAKMNGLDDVGMIRALYEASRAGVQIDLIVRGHSRIRPGIPGFSENIRVMSILGRFLEHDRIFYFANGSDPHVFIGSADWRHRNLDERVEALVRVDDRGLQDYLRQILEDALMDNRSAWDLGPDGRYTLRRPKPGEEVRDFQDSLMRRTRERQPRGVPRLISND